MVYRNFWMHAWACALLLSGLVSNTCASFDFAISGDLSPTSVVLVTRHVMEGQETATIEVQGGGGEIDGSFHAR